MEVSTRQYIIKGNNPPRSVLTNYKQFVFQILILSSAEARGVRSQVSGHLAWQIEQQR